MGQYPFSSGAFNNVAVLCILLPGQQNNGEFATPHRITSSVLFGHYILEKMTNLHNASNVQTMLAMHETAWQFQYNVRQSMTM